MKKLIIVVLASCIAAAAFAQAQGDFKKGKPDFEKIRAEKVGFITSEVGLTVAEAEAFWPVYNKIDEEQRALNKAEREAYKALNKALKDGQGDVEALLNDYLKAKEANVNLHVKGYKDYKKVLPVEKVAKFYTCEEKFRRQQIGKLGGGNRGHMGGGRGRGPKGEFNGKGDFQGRGEGQKGDAPRENFRGGQGRMK